MDVGIMAEDNKVYGQTVAVDMLLEFVKEYLT